MNYKFPTIENLDQVRPVIKGRKEFTILSRGPYTVVSYQVVKPDTFKDVTGFKSAARRECRGLIFDKNGKIMRRSYHKFFNMNERPETLIKNIDWNKSHVILEKLDGSMVTPLVFNNNQVRWATKLGITGVAMEVEEFIVRNDLQNYIQFAIECSLTNVTPIFEWCSNKNKIVLDYPEDQLILTGMRHNATGEYVHYYELLRAEQRNIPVVKQLFIEDLENVSQMEETEGVVVRFDDGHMVKIKTEWYVLRHKTKELASSEKNVLKLIINSELDDVKQFLTEVEFERMQNFNNDVLNGIIDKASELQDFIQEIRTNHSRKDFALLYNTDGVLSKIDKAIVFNLYDKSPVWLDDVQQQIIAAIQNNLSSSNRIENVRYLWGGKRWSDY